VFVDPLTSSARLFARIPERLKTKGLAVEIFFPHDGQNLAFGRTGCWQCGQADRISAGRLPCSARRISSASGKRKVGSSCMAVRMTCSIFSLIVGLSCRVVPAVF